MQFPGFDAKAKSSYWGGQVVPHLAAGYAFNFPWCTVEPFTSLDCAVLFQQGFSEEGASPLNMQQNSSWSELFRSEIGLHAYEIWNTKIGDFVLRESISYINKEPFGIGKIQANIVGFPGAFSVILLKTTKA